MKRYHTVIESLGVYLPPRKVSSREIIDGCQHDLRLALDLATGIQHRRMAGDTEFAIDLAQKAVEDCLRSSRHSPGDIDLLICTNIARCDGPQQSWTMEPSTSARLCRRFGMKSTLAFDLSNACAGMFTGVLVADALLKSGCIDRALVVSGEYISLLAETAQKEIESIRDPRLACLTLGDAGAAVLLERSQRPEVGFLGLDLYTLGAFSSLCVAAPTSEPHGGVIMNTDMNALAEVCHKHGLMHAVWMLEQLRQAPEEVDWIVPHQTSKWTLGTVGLSLVEKYGDAGRAGSRIINNLKERGNTASTTHFVALHDQMTAGQIKPDQSLMFSINASGATIGTALYRLDDLPQRLGRGVSKKTSSSAFEPPGFLSGDGPPMVCMKAVGTIPVGDCREADSVQLLARAVQACSGGPVEEVDLLIQAGVYRQGLVMEPATAAQVAGAVSMNADLPSVEGRKTLAFDLFNGAAGFLNACLVGVEFINSGRFRRVMVCAAESGAPAPIVSSAAAVVLEPSQDEGCGFGAFFTRLFPELCDSLTVHITTRSGPPYSSVRHGDPELEGLFVECIGSAVGEFLETLQLELHDFEWILPPQISKSFLRRLSSNLKLSAGKVVDAVHPEGDLFTTSFPFSWQTLQREKKPGTGQKGLIISVGSGLQVCCAIYHF